MHSPILYNYALFLGLAKLVCQTLERDKSMADDAYGARPTISTRSPFHKNAPPPRAVFFCAHHYLSLFAFRFTWFIGLFAYDVTGQMWLTFLVFFFGWFCFLCRYCNYRAVCPAWVQIWRATARADYVRKYSNQLFQKKWPLVSLSGYDD